MEIRNELGASASSLEEQSRSVIRAGSKSFSLASRLFSPAIANSAAMLYAWCRHCDDVIDRRDESEDASELLKELRARTISAMNGEPQGDPAFAALACVAKTYGIPAFYPLELIEGMAMDVELRTYETPDELDLYCYRVAGTVGLMMTHIMGLFDQAALQNAASLGSAMQLTNIARDVMEDASMGRVYLPLQWLREESVPAAGISRPEHRPAVARVVKRLLAEADRHYLNGEQGLKHLPLKAAFAVAAASRIYRQIGRKILRRGPHAWDTRTVVSLPEKLLVLFQSFFTVVCTIPARISNPREPVRITKTWQIWRPL
jgi:phytoene synthase